jgi:hypothetical protein
MPNSILERRHAEIEHRFFITLLSFSLLADMLNPAIMIMNTYGSMVRKVAEVAFLHPAVIAGMFVFCALLALPNTIVTILWKNRFANRLIIKMSVAAYALCSLVWVIMAYASRRLDEAWLVQLYLQDAGVSLAFSAALAVMLNNQMKRIKRMIQNDSAVPA